MFKKCHVGFYRADGSFARSTYCNETSARAYAKKHGLSYKQLEPAWTAADALKFRLKPSAEHTALYGSE